MRNSEAQDVANECCILAAKRRDHIRRLEAALMECRRYFDGHNLHDYARRIGEALIGQEIGDSLGLQRCDCGEHIIGGVCYACSVPNGSADVAK
jgi:hypothetical protein